MKYKIVELEEYQDNSRQSPMIFSRGGDSHMKQMGMLVISLTGINFGF